MLLPSRIKAWDSSLSRKHVVRQWPPRHDEAELVEVVPDVEGQHVRENGRQEDEIETAVLVGEAVLRCLEYTIWIISCCIYQLFEI